MKNRDAKQRAQRRRFKIGFSFKRKDHAGRTTNITRRQCLPISDSILVVPTVQRLTASSPPLAILNRINGSKSLSTGRSLSCALFSSSPPVLHKTGSPYQSKKAQKSLSSSLTHCQCKSESNDSYSAWERRQPSSISKRDFTPWIRSKSVAEGSSTVDLTITESSNSEFLPPDISPANKFVPIGHEEDDDAFSFASGDYDICTQSFGESDQLQEPVSNNAPLKGYSDDIMYDKYTVSLDDQTKLQLTPSPLSTEDTSSRESGLSKECHPVTRFHNVKSFDHNTKEWFPHVKQEIMKLASCFTQCGATGKSTL